MKTKNSLILYKKWFVYPKILLLLKTVKLKSIFKIIIIGADNIFIVAKSYICNTIVIIIYILHD